MVVVFADSCGSSNTNLKMAKSTDAGITFSPVQQLPSTSLEEHFPSVAVAPNGRIMIVYSRTEPGVYQQTMAISSTDTGTTWLSNQAMSNSAYSSIVHDVVLDGDIFYTAFSQNGAMGLAQMTATHSGFGRVMQVSHVFQPNLVEHASRLCARIIINPQQPSDRRPVIVWSEEVSSGYRYRIHSTAAAFWGVPAINPGTQMLLLR
ncbi:MAG: exo-alpha-sialidase [Desulfobacteraceae bacterium]|nr:MAG: exo-alpha-sialidase [Desulfobacteraceae bacterium]